MGCDVSPVAMFLSLFYFHFIVISFQVDNVDNLMIIFIDNSRLSTRVLDVMETIDDDCDRRDVVFVKVKVIGKHAV